MPRSLPSDNSSRFTMLASFCLVVTSLYFGQAVLVPLALAFLFTFLLTPLVFRLERIGIPRVVAACAVVFLGVCLIGGLGWTLSSQAVDLANRLPQYKKNITDKISHLPFIHGNGAFSKFTSAADEIKNDISPAESEGQKPMPVVITGESTVGMSQIGRLLGVIAGPLATAFIVAVFVIFMLIRREDLRDRLIRLIGGGRIDITTKALTESGNRISRYLLMQSLVNTGYGIVIWIGLWSIGHFSGQKGGFPDAPLWGLVCALCRFVPYVGPPLGAFFPVLLSIAVFPGARESIATIGLFVGVEALNNSAIEPMLYGATTGLSAVAVLAAAVFWSWLWGPIGLLLSTPLTACLLVVGEYVPQMEFLGVLLGDKPPLPPATQLYQRLLALDSEAVSDVVQEYRKTMSLETLYDTVVIPALAMAERDHQRNHLDDARYAKMRQSVRDALDELGEHERSIVVKKEAAAVERAAKTDAAPAASPIEEHPRLPSECSVTVLCLPANNESDELVGVMISQLLELRGYCTPVLGQSTLASEMLDAVKSNSADIILVSALPPTAITHARYLCKRLQSKYPSISIVVGLWTVEGDLVRAKERIADSETVHVISTLGGALDEIHQIAQATLLGHRQETPTEPAIA